MIRASQSSGFKGVTSVTVWRIAILASHFSFSFLLFLFCLTESCLFVVYSFHSPQVLLEFCGFMQLSAVSFFSEFSRVLWSAVFQLGIL